MLCVLMEIITHASAKKKTKRPKGFQISHFYGLFLNATMAVKGLKSRTRRLLNQSRKITEVS